MYRGKHYLSIEDLQLLMGTANIGTVYRRHRAICAAIHPLKKNLTIMEFCKFEGHEFEEIWGILRGETPYP